ncbi:MAG: hypothetical protein C4324_01340 [Blastocatellia bacterium]
MKIIIATDGSPYSVDAVRETCELFREKRGMIIKIVSAYEDEYAIAAEPFAISADLYREIAEAAERQAIKNCEDAAAIVKAELAEISPEVTTEILKGSPEQEIVELAKSWGANLIVVGSHGRGFWGRLLGSVSDGVVHHSPCSVLVVRKIAEGK